MNDALTTLQSTDPRALVIVVLLLFGLHVWLRRGHVPRKERKERTKRRTHLGTQKD